MAQPEPITPENVSRRSEELKVYLASNPPSYLKDVAVMLLGTVLTQMKPANKSST